MGRVTPRPYQRPSRRFRHEALFYSGVEEFVAGTLPFIREATAAAEPVLVVVPDAKIRLLEAELGSEADLVMFRDMDEVGRNPARIIPVWRDFVERRAQPGGAVRGVAEPVWRGRRAPELVECDHHESLLNLAFADGPPWRLLCPYDTSALTADVIEAARRSHPVIIEGGVSQKSKVYLDPVSAPSPLEVPLPAPRRKPDQLTVTIEGLRAARNFVFARARKAGLGRQRASDLVLAADEALGNSIRHGGGRGNLRVWRQDDSFVCEVADRGQITQPLVGRSRPRSGQSSGYGLWLVNQLCDLVQIRSAAGATTVRLHMRLPTPASATSIRRTAARQAPSSAH